MSCGVEGVMADHRRQAAGGEAEPSAKVSSLVSSHAGCSPHLQASLVGLPLPPRRRTLSPGHVPMALSEGPFQVSLFTRPWREPLARGVW